MHMDPAVPNYGPPGQGPRLRAGMALAIEPMITRGGDRTVELLDGWTVVTADGSRAAHFEHTVAITPEGPWVLTALEDKKSDLALLARGDSATPGGTTPLDPPAHGGASRPPIPPGPPGPSPGGSPGFPAPAGAPDAR